MVASDSWDRRRRLVSSLSPPSIGDGGLLHAVDTSLGPHQITLKNRHYSPIIMHVESPPRYWNGAFQCQFLEGTGLSSNLHQKHDSPTFTIIFHAFRPCLLLWDLHRRVDAYENYSFLAQYSMYSVSTLFRVLTAHPARTLQSAGRCSPRWPLCACRTSGIRGSNAWTALASHHWNLLAPAPRRSGSRRAWSVRPVSRIYELPSDQPTRSVPGPFDRSYFYGPSRIGFRSDNYAPSPWNSIEAAPAVACPKGRPPFLVCLSSRNW